MPNNRIDEIKCKIAELHEGDEKQLEVIFSESPRVIVEAPAGFGKTTTMISRIAYLYASGKIPNPKKILGLTFSVNAALKVKREVAGKLPVLLNEQNSPITIGEKISVTNYHGFCKGVLKKYGYLIADALRKDINLFRAISDGEVEKNPALRMTLTDDEIEKIKSIEGAIKEVRPPDSEAIHKYNDIIIQKLLPLDYVTHNAIILFVLQLLDDYQEIKKFYQGYYPLIVVDEFQDTNCIAWNLLKSLVSDNTQLLFLGDPLQRIYGFIGALPNIMSEAIARYNMEKITLSKNYRFHTNPEMLKLDRNIRANAEFLFAPTISNTETANLPAFWGITQRDEAEQVANKVTALIKDGKTKVAILCKSRGKNTDIFEDALVSAGIPYFYGMFRDEDTDYVNFHNRCQITFIRQFGNLKAVNKKSLTAFSDKIKTSYSSDPGKMTDSLLQLLDALIEKVSIDYGDLQPEDRYTLLLDIFENRQLKQAMEYVDSQVILSTIHGAKGLEWDYVVLTDVEQWVMTFQCKKCPSSSQNAKVPSCLLPPVIPKEIMIPLIDDLCVFYVGLTRARKQVYISASRERFNAKGRIFDNGKVSCFAYLNGIRPVDANKQISK